jgi:hypothetical protein
MSDREERIAKNEAITREINEGIEDAMASLSDGYVRMMCECGRSDCELLIAITVAEYEEARRDGRRFVMVKDHVVLDIERLVLETERFVVVEKLDGTPAEVAEEEDPRD